ncbi:MAG: RNA polymerase sigma-70 factor [Flavobacteriales bacterium]
MYDQSNILEGLKLKDEKSFELLFKTHYESLVRFVYKYLNDIEESEEIVQDTFYTLWEKSETITIQSSIKSYLFQAARNKSLNSIKHRNVKQKYADAVLNSDSEFSEEGSMEMEELQDKINEALEMLPPKCRQVFELSRFEEKKYREIAEELNISIKTVENHMGKALGLLRTSLKEYLPIYLALVLEIIKK